MIFNRIGSTCIRLASSKYCFRPISRSRLVVGSAFFGNMDSSAMQPTLTPSISSRIPGNDDGDDNDDNNVGFQPPPIVNHQGTATGTAEAMTSAPDQQTQGSTKKARHSKQQKRDRKATQMQPEEGVTVTTQENKQEDIQLQIPKTPVERILACARNAQFTRSVWIEPRFGPGPRYSSPSRAHIVTRSVLPGYDAPSKPHDPRCITIRIKPLLILDLNGVLCHRS